MAKTKMTIKQVVKEIEKQGFNIVGKGDGTFDIVPQRHEAYVNMQNEMRMQRMKTELPMVRWI